MKEATVQWWMILIQLQAALQSLTDETNSLAEWQLIMHALFDPSCSTYDTCASISSFIKIIVK